MNDIIFNWKGLVQESNKQFFKISSNKWKDKYYLFVYLGKAFYTDKNIYKSPRYIDITFYLKVKTSNHRYKKIFKSIKKIGFFDNIQDCIKEIIEKQIFSYERKNKIFKLLEENI